MWAIELVTSVVRALALTVRRRMVNLFATRKRRTTGQVLRKYSIAEHREWQGKALVTVPEQRMLDISVDGLSFSPVQWKFDRVSEGEDIDVVIKVGRVDRKFQIFDVGPF
ncbi:hypothetical protein M3I54_24710 [Paraburkholderia sp. CNPSo 3274]|uniref:hypothetical protein n=1 Tax=Paraburkholderia sp. CNPSo 3274 TaxID=2940932 RepID=UPI0020B82EBA|nr:hypothetical protein [Paraburkholderia sp. CNPSo 3274]MCP3710129.1 hypothetical protein [Paraburkholderia sp. CNPSo 3274]